MDSRLLVATYSIAACDLEAGQWGVATQSKFVAVGSVVTWAEPHVGAIATQAYANPRYGPDGLSLLREGASADEVAERLTSADDGRDHRQVGIVDGRGRAASYTGSECLDWAGGRAGPGYAIQGNILVGPQVVETMEQAWLSFEDTAASASLRLARRLFAVLAAGDAAGGDRRGRQSASLAVVGLDGGIGPVAARGQGADVVVDLRVDDHADPVGELGRLLGLADLYFGEPDPSTLLPLAGELADEVDGRVRALGYPDLATWAGVENYEGRLVEGAIDPVVLAKLREAGT
jgi:uncharacterized Ntn-hydrolase superfamily protein